MTGPFLRIRVHSSTRTYPLDAFRYLEHGPRGIVWMVFADGTPIRLAERCSEEECLDLEAAVLYAIAGARGGRDAADLIDLDDLVDIARIELAEARDMAAVDAMLAAAERDGETGYDGARSDHSVVECRGGGA